MDQGGAGRGGGALRGHRTPNCVITPGTALAAQHPDPGALALSSWHPTPPESGNTRSWRCLEPRLGMLGGGTRQQPQLQHEHEPQTSRTPPETHRDIPGVEEWDKGSQCHSGGGTLGCPQPHTMDVPWGHGRPASPGHSPGSAGSSMFLQNPRGLVLFPPCGLVWGEKRFPSCVPGSWNRRFPHRGGRAGFGGAQPTLAMPHRVQLGAQGEKEVPEL